MPNRRAFWEWAFHAPLENPASRRKAKLRATVARLAFTSLCIQTWGFNGYMEQLYACPDMYWLGGQPGHTASDGNKYPGPHAEDLASLARKDKPRYQATIKNAMTPVAVDSYGYESMRSYWRQRTPIIRGPRRNTAS
ncbi:hypothetical protein DVH05_019253 [Phytophthora capsici]|nr:hypothetical protein DVH05_019253 [Phytophthora capsici]